MPMTDKEDKEIERTKVTRSELSLYLEGHYYFGSTAAWVGWTYSQLQALMPSREDNYIARRATVLGFRATKLRRLGLFRGARSWAEREVMSEVPATSVSPALSLGESR